MIIYNAYFLSNIYLFFSTLIIKKNYVPLLMQYISFPCSHSQNLSCSYDKVKAFILFLCTWNIDNSIVPHISKPLGRAIFVISFGNVKWDLHIAYILRNFKNATFYVDCFLNWVDLMLFPIQYFILSRDKRQLTITRILLRPFILTLP